MWRVVDHDDTYSLVREFDTGRKSIAYAPQYVPNRYGGHMFRLYLSDAPDFTLSLSEGILAYLLFRVRVREFRRQKAFDRQHRTINFLKESWV
jgi:hypothetical protein